MLFLIKLLRLIRGYITFAAQGGFTERFINLCQLNGVNLWLVENDGVKVKACTTPEEYKRICGFALNSGMEIKVLQQRGLPFFAKRHKWRCGALCGVFFMIVFIAVMSMFIWNVEVVENDVKVIGFTDELRNQGVRVGSLKSNVDVLQVQENLLERFPELSWVSVNIFGSKAQVEYSIAKKQQPLQDTETPINIVAKKRGEIVLVEGYRGTNQIKEGDFVAEGTLLISGVITNGDLTEEFVHAQGKVMAKTENNVNVIQKAKCENKITCDSDALYSLYFLGLTMPFGIKKDEGLSCNTKIYLEGNDTVLPVGVHRRDSLTFYSKNVTFTPSRQRLLCLKKIVMKKRSICENAEVGSFSIAEKVEKDRIVMKATVKCVEDIALEKEIFVEKN